ncbi:MAG: sulfatase [Candidatus Eisenbacteria bacterium]
MILITVDTLRADRLGCYGSARVLTPHMDRLAREGTLFADCVSPVPSTSPSHATILSGLLPVTHGLRENGAELSPDVPLLAEAFREGGYRTAAFVSGFPLLGRFGFDRGFDLYDDRLSDGFTTREGRTQGTERVGRKTVDAFLRWLDEADGPFFAWVHLFDPHAVYGAPRPFQRMYYSGSGERDPSNTSLEGIDLPPYLMLPGVTDVRFPVALYEGEVAYADHQIGRLLRGLEERGLLDRALLVFTADHGESMTEHGYHFGHSHFLYEPSLRVPLVFRWQGKVPAGSIVEEPVSLTDLLDTILDLAGLGPAVSGEGSSLAPALAGGTPVERTIILERPPMESGLLFGARRGPWKYMRTGEGVEELYHLDDDPGELRNLAGANPERASILRDEVIRKIGEGGIERPPIDEETRERLRSLGYVDG